MPSRLPVSRRTLCAWGISVFASLAAGCGTIIYPERRGQPAGRLDWGIVALDAVGLLLFFVPGVIAFAVDFSNGTIYLPADEYYGSQPRETSDAVALRSVPLGTTAPSPADVEAAIHRETQISVNLHDDRVLSKPLHSLTDFWTAARSLRPAA